MNVADMTDEEVRDLDPEMLNSRSECIAAMNRMDLIKADIQGQLNAALAKWEADGEKANPKWLYAAKSALRYCKVQRAALQARASILRRVETEQNIKLAAQKQEEENVLFIKAAKAMLPEETYLAIWATVNRAT